MLRLPCVEGMVLAATAVRIVGRDGAHANHATEVSVKVVLNQKHCLRQQARMQQSSNLTQSMRPCWTLQAAAGHVSKPHDVDEKRVCQSGRRLSLYPEFLHCTGVGPRSGLSSGGEVQPWHQADAPHSRSGRARLVCCY